MANAGQIDKATLHRDRILSAGLVPSADAIGSVRRCNRVHSLTP